MNRSGAPAEAGSGAPLRVLFVCTANICRSAYAEVVARHLAWPGAGVVFSSAGTYGLAARPMNRDIEVFLPEGVTSEGFSSRRVTGTIIAGADLVLTAEAAHRTFLIEEYPASFRRIFLMGQFAEAVSRSELSGRALVEHVTRTRPPARSSHDVRDPYHRGSEANAQAAAQITQLLQVIVPALVPYRGGEARND